MQEIQIEEDSLDSEVSTLRREIWALRDIAVSSMAENANLNLRLNIAQQRIKQLEKVARHRNQMMNSATWKIGKAVMKCLYPIKRLLTIGRKESQTIGQQR